MSFAIGILNKRCAVIAADSASTITSNKRKTAADNSEKHTAFQYNKLMRLTSTDEASVGIMFTGKGKINNELWPNIVVKYRSMHGGEKLCGVIDYVNNFIGFLADYFGIEVKEEEFKASSEKDDTTLAFTGYGKDDEYPTIITVFVRNEKTLIKYCVAPKDVCENKNEGIICKENQAVIKCIGCDSVFNSFLLGVNEEFVHAEYTDSLIYKMFAYKQRVEELRDQTQEDNNVYKILSMLWVDASSNLKLWKKQIKDYEIPEMVELANMFVDLTELYYILRGLPRDVGGPIDIAIITKEEGFKWVQCKNSIFASENKFPFEPLNR